jgi:hypothetical protein
MGGHKHLKNMSSKSHKAHALKNIQKFLSAHKYSSLAKGGVYWPYHSEQCFTNARRAGPRSVAPQLHEVALTMRDPRSHPYGLYK